MIDTFVHVCMLGPVRPGVPEVELTSAMCAGMLKPCAALACYNCGC